MVGNLPGLLLVLLASAVTAYGSDYSMRFFGNGTGDIDRVKIPLDNPHRSVNLGSDLTIEFWIRAQPGSNTGTVDCSSVSGGDRWITGNTIFDRDVYGAGDFGDYGIALGNGRIVFGVDAGPGSITICGTTNVADGNWHHVAAVRRRSDGLMRIFVDGAIDASGNGGTGDIGYRNGRATNYPNSDPFLVIGAEKHDAGFEYPSFRGWIDEIRISDIVRYGAAFARPALHPIEDDATVALYHFFEGSGDLIIDATGSFHGIRRFGGNPMAGPEYSNDSVFNTPSVNRSLSGRLATPGGSPLSNSLVRIKLASSSQTLMTVVTDADGRYVFPDRATGFLYEIAPFNPRFRFRPIRHIIHHTDTRNDLDFFATRKPRLR